MIINTIINYQIEFILFSLLYLIYIIISIYRKGIYNTVIMTLPIFILLTIRYFFTDYSVNTENISIESKDVGLYLYLISVVVVRVVVFRYLLLPPFSPKNNGGRNIYTKLIIVVFVTCLNPKITSKIISYISHYFITPWSTSYNHMKQLGISIPNIDIFSNNNSDTAASASAASSNGYLKNSDYVINDYRWVYWGLGGLALAGLFFFFYINYASPAELYWKDPHRTSVIRYYRFYRGNYWQNPVTEEALKTYTDIYLGGTKQAERWVRTGKI